MPPAWCGLRATFSTAVPRNASEPKAAQRRDETAYRDEKGAEQFDDGVGGRANGIGHRLAACPRLQGLRPGGAVTVEGIVGVEGDDASVRLDEMDTRTLHRA